MAEEIKLTHFAHGAGCGCKIAPQVLEEILKSDTAQPDFPELLVGNSSKDDAAVYQLNEEEALISTTDFFTPIVDDPFIFGKVAAANAISDVYAMGGRPLVALAILGWPVEKLPAEIARKVIEGAKSICSQVQIPIAGGHTIDSPEPIFGLAVSGRVRFENLKQNNTANEGDFLLLSKPLGVGILATAAKRGVISIEDLQVLEAQLVTLNTIGEKMGGLKGVTAMTDVTGFGLAGHLIEMAEGAGLSVRLEYAKVPKLEGIKQYLAKNVIPDATYRNWKGYQHKINLGSGVDMMQAFQLLPDPQTNGGLLIAVKQNSLASIQEVLQSNGYSDFIEPIGQFIAQDEKVLWVE